MSWSPYQLNQANKTTAAIENASSLLHSPPVEASQALKLPQPEDAPAYSEKPSARCTVPGNDFHMPSYYNRSLSNKSPPSPGLQRIIVDYYKDLNPFVILVGALGQPRPRGLVQTDDAKSASMPSQEREISLLDPIDRAYLQQRRVHQLPPEQVR
jgi:hypothetical protein